MKLFNDLLSNGTLPAGTSWLGMMYETENNKSIDEVFAKFEVCTRCKNEQQSLSLPERQRRHSRL